MPVVLDLSDMGYKAFTIFASSPEAHALTDFPRHQPEKARSIVSRLGARYELVGAATLENGLYPKDDTELYVGAYDGSFVLGSIPLADSAFSGGTPEIVHRLNEALPRCRVLAILLHSVVDLFGYAWFEDGRLVRGRAGSAEDGVFFNVGKPLSAEKKLSEFDPELGGEGMVMELCRPFLGCRLDEFTVWDLKMELFVKR